MYATASARDHPRIRGEHSQKWSIPVTLGGSSPHTRGALGDDSYYFAFLGIIPAYAGSTFSNQWRISFLRDHPRIRGEHKASASISTGSPGSSPHTRGAQQQADVALVAGGIIPAYAGSTSVAKSPYSALRDHPRIRGEHGGHLRCVSCNPGSSPHTRGAH